MWKLFSLGRREHVGITQTRKEFKVKGQVECMISSWMEEREIFVIFGILEINRAQNEQVEASGFDETIFPTTKYSSDCSEWEKVAIWEEEKEKETERSEACRNVICCFLGECSHQLFVITPFHCIVLFLFFFLLACSILIVYFAMVIQSSMNGFSTLRFY